MHPSIIRSCRASAAALALMLAPLAANAQSSGITVTQSLSALPQNAGVSLMELGTTNVNGLVTNNTLTFNGGTISFAGAAGVYHGAVKGVTAPPYTPSGPETKNYFTAQPNGDITFNFENSQKYFGINWGSVDGYNTLNFYQSGALVKSITGSQVVSNPTGIQSAAGSYLLNVNFNGSASFDKVVMKSSSPAFEFNVVAYSPTAIDLSVVAGKGPTVVTLLDTVSKTIVGAPAPLPGLAATPLGLIALIGAGGVLFRRRAIC